MKYLYIALFFLFAYTAKAQDSSPTHIRASIANGRIKTYEPNEIIPFDTIPQMHYDKYFIDAFDELTIMLNDSSYYNFKRAVFLVEWAYFSGNLDYNSFNLEIEHTANNLRKFINLMNIQHYKTAANAALFNYFTKPSWMNQNLAFSYDIEDCGGDKDFSKLFVSKLMRTHSGQCVSLPLYYKILCHEIGGKAFLASAPRHMYIKHLGENNEWVNVELTTGSFARDEWYIQTMGVTTEAIKNGVFLSAMSTNEDIAYMIYMLGIAYLRKYGDYDYFTLMCANQILEKLPKNCYGLMLRIGTRQQWGYNYVKKIGKIYSDFIMNNSTKFHRDKDLLNSLGYTKISIAEYIKNVEQSYFDLGKDTPLEWKKFRNKAK